MKDRVAAYPGRYRIVSQSGGYITLERADQPSQEGTPLNKNTFLKDATATLFGLTGSAVPDDVFAAIAIGKAQIAVGSYTGTGVYGASNQNSLSFGFTPKLVVIYGGLQMFTPYIYGSSRFYTGDKSSNYEQVVTINGNTMQWYSNGGNAGYQLNASGTTYNYCAIGV